MILLKFATAINGDSTVPEHDKWITCSSFQLGVGRSISASGGGKDRDTSNPSFSEATITKSTDVASSDLFAQAIYGKGLGKAEVHFIQTGGTGSESQVYLIYEMDEAIISSYSVSSGGDRPSESFSINFTKISMTYHAFSGTTKTTGTAKKWDLMANKLWA